MFYQWFGDLVNDTLKGSTYDVNEETWNIYDAGNSTDFQKIRWFQN